MKALKSQVLFALLFTWIITVAANPMVELIVPKDFVRGKGAPVVEEIVFNVPEAGTAVLEIGNGLAGARVSSAVITLNGVSVLTPAEFNQNVGSLLVPVSLQAGANSLKVELRSKPGSSLTAFISAPVDAIDLLPVPAPLQKDVDSLVCQAVVSALGIPAAGVTVAFSVSGFDGVVRQAAETDATGVAAVTFAPFAITGVGMVTAEVDDADPALADAESFEVFQPTSSPRTIALTAGVSMVNTTMGGSEQVAYNVALSGAAGQTTHVVFTQQVIPDFGGLAISNDAPVGGWVATADQQWQVTASFGALLPGIYIVQTTATIVETSQSVSLDVLVLVDGFGPPMLFGGQP